MLNKRIHPIVVVSIFLVVLILLFPAILNGINNYSYRIRCTDFELRRARINIDEFKRTMGRNPYSLLEISKLATSDPNLPFDKRQFKELILDIDGNISEYDELNGKGGFCYISETGQVKVNLTKPVGYYFRFYIGAHRNEIPSDW